MDFQKIFENLVDLFLEKNFEKKTGQKGVFRHFLENVYKKIAFFWRALPSSSIYWRQRHLLKTFRVRLPKMDISK